VDGCVKRGCESRAETVVAVRHGPKEVVVTDLEGERDPRLLALCRPHADDVSPPIGWCIIDRRATASAEG